MTATENQWTHWSVMRSDNTVIYIIAAVILLHFVVGIGYLIYKLTKKK
ncbi:hypothetical protein [Flagellimonas marinaquae]|nr:hypothetical protein [Allomuricauda aquimarina]